MGTLLTSKSQDGDQGNCAEPLPSWGPSCPWLCRCPCVDSGHHPCHIGWAWVPVLCCWVPGLQPRHRVRRCAHSGVSSTGHHHWPLALPRSQVPWGHVSSGLFVPSLRPAWFCLGWWDRRPGCRGQGQPQTDLAPQPPSWAAAAQQVSAWEP